MDENYCLIHSFLAFSEALRVSILAQISWFDLVGPVENLELSYWFDIIQIAQITV